LFFRVSSERGRGILPLFPGAFDATEGVDDSRPTRRAWSGARDARLAFFLAVFRFRGPCPATGRWGSGSTRRRPTAQRTASSPSISSPPTELPLTRSGKRRAREAMEAVSRARSGAAFFGKPCDPNRVGAVQKTDLDRAPAGFKRTADAGQRGNEPMRRQRESKGPCSSSCPERARRRERRIAPVRIGVKGTFAHHVGSVERRTVPTPKASPAGEPLQRLTPRLGPTSVCPDGRVRTTSQSAPRTHRKARAYRSPPNEVTAGSALNSSRRVTTSVTKTETASPCLPRPTASWDGLFRQGLSVRRCAALQPRRAFR